MRGRISNGDATAILPTADQVEGGPLRQALIQAVRDRIPIGADRGQRTTAAEDCPW
jgi:hypothetical protein